MDKKRALIAMSGGVDSSVAAALMCRSGYTCVGVTMKLYAGEETCNPRANSCCTLADVEDARSVCYELGMQYFVCNFMEDFSEKVISRFIKAYEMGETPNPCIDCNRYMKFDKLYDRAKVLDCSTIVTGHYARIAWDAARGRWLLKKARNEAKDQSYVLYFMTQEQLAHTILPLGDYESKEDVRAVAETYGFVNARKHDSQDICFVQDGDYADFIEQQTGKTFPPGNFVDEAGNVLGRHRGIIHYTVGQRRGLGLALKAPMYVVRKNTADNTVVLAYAKDAGSNGLYAGDFNWILYDAPKTKVPVTIRTRYHAKEVPGTAEVCPDGTVHIRFETPQRAVAPGQAVVLYDGENVVGGGVILRAEP